MLPGLQTGAAMTEKCGCFSSGIALPAIGFADWLHLWGTLRLLQKFQSALRDWNF